jgi:hypothetical protein
MQPRQVIFLCINGQSYLGRWGATHSFDVLLEHRCVVVIVSKGIHFLTIFCSDTPRRI